MNKVYPELEIPGKRTSHVQYEKSVTTPPETLIEGAIKVSGLDICLLGDNNMKPTELTASACSQDDVSKKWRLTDAGYKYSDVSLILGYLYCCCSLKV